MQLGRNDLLALLGAGVGGVIGYFAFVLLASFGFYALVMPGGFVGIGGGIVRCRSMIVPMVCGIVALALGIFTEWHFRPFVADETLGYFLAHVFDLNPITLIMLALGTIVGFWIPLSKRERAAAARKDYAR
jgi:hypothetical protein